MSQTYTCCECGYSRPRQAEIDSRTFVTGDTHDEDICIDCWDKRRAKASADFANRLDNIVDEVMTNGGAKIEIAPGVSIHVEY